MDYLSLFSGIGGFEKGIENSKYNEELKCIGFSEVDKYATSIYKRHFPKHRELGDVTKIRTEDLPEFEFLVGGFPCQAFSIAGKRRGFDDTRGTLFFEIARVLKDKKPKYFLLENVKGLLSHDKGRTFQTILKVLSELGYDAQWEIFNSKDYGVPHNRERIYIKGYNREKCRGEIFSTSTQKAILSTKIERLGNCAKNGHGTSDVMSLEGICKCLTATDYMHPKWIIDNNQNLRKLTPLECERLQGFPDNWTKFGVNDELISNTQRYKCCGNAVTTNVITHIFNNWDLKL